MTVGYEVKVDRQQLNEAIAFFEFVRGNTADAVRVAINKTGPKIRTLASKEIRGQVRLKAGYVKDRLTLHKATRSNLVGKISAPSKGVLMSRYSTDTKISGDKVSWIKRPEPPARGIKVKIKPDQPPKVVQGGGDIEGKPWYLVLNNGRVAIAGRRKTPGPRGGKIKVFHAPSLSQVFTDVKEDVMPAAGEEYTKQMGDAMRYLLAKRQPR